MVVFESLSSVLFDIHKISNMLNITFNDHTCPYHFMCTKEILTPNFKVRLLGPHPKGFYFPKINK